MQSHKYINDLASQNFLSRAAICVTPKLQDQVRNSVSFGWKKCVTDNVVDEC